MIALLARPQWLNPEWQSGMPPSDLAWAAGLVAMVAAATWGAFRARVILSDGQVRVVNPWGTSTFPTAEVVAVLPGDKGVRFDLASGRSVSAFAVQCTALHRGQEPRWVDLARAVTGREPDRE